MIFAASALSTPRNASPAELGLLREAMKAYGAPASTLTAPPIAADSAPCRPHRNPNASVRTAVAITCHPRTMRKGLNWDLPVLRAPEAKKAAGLYQSERAPTASG